MFDSDEESVVFSTDLEREHGSVRRSASPFSTDVEENGAGVSLVPELIIHPVSLLIGLVSVLASEVIDLVREGELVKVIHADLEPFTSGSCTCEGSAGEK